MSSYKRIQRAQRDLGLSDVEMAQRLHIDVEEFLSLASAPSAAFCTTIEETFGISQEFLLKGQEPIFVWRALPIEPIMAFGRARNWKPYHTPKDLALSLSLEAAELLECFQWSGEDVWVDEKADRMADELADIFIYAVQFAEVMGFDIPTIIIEKLAQNERKYPVEQARNSAKKYTEFED